MKITKVRLYLVVVFCLPLAPRVHAQSKTDSPAPTPSLDFFAGRWHCDGKFTSSGKSISARLVFEPILGGKFLLFRHDDEPPFGYHAWSEWRWDASAGQFVSTVQDSGGGIRLFRSPGWIGQTFVWSGGDLQNSSDQRFVFERLDNRNFRVSYSHKKNDSWLAVDSSACRRVETK